MKKLIALGLMAWVNLAGANQGLYCKNENYMAYERFSSDPYHIHIVNLDGDRPEVRHIKLPYKVTSKLGMNCQSNHIELKGKFHYVKIDIADINKPKISKRPLIESDKRLNPPEFSLYKNKGAKDPLAVLESGHSYHLNIRRMQTNEVYPTGANRVEHIRTELLVLDANGKIESRKLLFTDMQWEPID